MTEFKFDPKLWDSLTDEQKKQLQDSQKQWDEATKKDFDSKLKTEKETWQKETETINAKQKETNDFLASAGDKRDLVNDLLQSGKTPEQIKTKYAYLFEQEKPQPQSANIDISSLLKNGGIAFENKPTPISDEEFIEKANSEGLDPTSKTYKTDLERYVRLKR